MIQPTSHFIIKMEIINVSKVEEKIGKIAGLRGARRKTALSTATENLYNYLKSLNYDNVTRGFLKSFFGDDVNPRTRKRVLRAIINELKKEGKIKEGLWGLYVEFGLAAANISSGPTGKLTPAAIVPVVNLGIQRFDKPNDLTVDANFY